MSITKGKLLKELTPLLSKCGIRVIKDEMCRRHRKLWVTDGEKKAFVIVSISPSDHRVLRNVVTTAKHAIREAP